MERKETNPEGQATAPHEVFNNNGALDRIIQTQGYDQGRLFSSRDKATYTFLFESDVISLHCDLTKKILYLKGHKITEWRDHPSLREFIARFRKALSGKNTSDDFVKRFDTLVARIL